MSDDNFSKEERILQMMRKVLTDVAKDTYTKPGLKHPLSENTILSIREWLKLIDTNTDTDSEKERNLLVKESSELMKIFGAILRNSQ